jgi:hypothetical protein
MTAKVNHRSEGFTLTGIKSRWPIARPATAVSVARVLLLTEATMTEIPESPKEALAAAAMQP